VLPLADIRAGHLRQFLLSLSVRGRSPGRARYDCAALGDWERLACEEDRPLVVRVWGRLAAPCVWQEPKG
jgi:hypothetical protein